MLVKIVSGHELADLPSFLFLFSYFPSTLQVSCAYKYIKLLIHNFFDEKGGLGCLFIFFMKSVGRTSYFVWEVCGFCLFGLVFYVGFMPWG